MSKFYTVYDVIFYSSNAVLVMHTLTKTVICIAVETSSFFSFSCHDYNSQPKNVTLHGRVGATMET